jgi:hypothetical protein
MPNHRHRPLRQIRSSTVRLCHSSAPLPQRPRRSLHPRSRTLPPTPHLIRRRLQINYPPPPRRTRLSSQTRIQKSVQLLIDPRPTRRTDLANLKRKAIFQTFAGDVAASERTGDFFVGFERGDFGAGLREEVCCEVDESGREGGCCGDYEV